MAHQVLRALLLITFFVLAVRYLQDALLLRLDLPLRPVRRKWLLAALTALLLGAIDLAGTALVVGLLLLDPLLALVVVKPLFWAAGALPFVWLFKVPFFTALKASAWAVAIAVVGDLLTRIAVLLVGGTLLARPLAMGAGLGGLALLVGLVLYLRHRQKRRLAKLAAAELSPAERERIAHELQPGGPQLAPVAAAHRPAPGQARYCPSCASEAPPGAERCPSCASTMDQLELDLLERRPLQLRWTAVFVGGMTLLLALVSLVPLVKLLFVGMRFPSRALGGAGIPGPDLPVVVSGGFLGIGAFLFLFVIGGVTLGALARRPIYRELAGGGVALSLVTWLIWAARAGGDAGMLLSHPMVLVDFAGQPLMTGPAPIFLLALNLLGALVALGAARVGALLAERMTGETCCRRCGQIWPLAPARSACPACGTPVTRREATEWRCVAPVVALTLLAFVLVTRLAGPSLAFYWRCDLADPSRACAEVARSYDPALSVFRAGGPDETGRGQALILHPAKYVGYLAPLFLLGPLLLAWRRRGVRAAGIAVALNAGGALLGALLLLGFALGGRGFAGAIQLQLLALLAWSAAGGAGLVLGKKLRRTDDFADIALAATDPAPHAAPGAERVVTEP